jgi:hypothetical protein
VCLVRGGPYLVVELGRRGARAGQPVQGDVGEQVVDVDCLVWQASGRIGPFPELLEDPGELSYRGIAKRICILLQNGNAQDHAVRDPAGNIRIQ